jgi:hypothetical protein
MKEKSLYDVIPLIQLSIPPESNSKLYSIKHLADIAIKMNFIKILTSILSFENSGK